MYVFLMRNFIILQFMSRLLLTKKKKKNIDRKYKLKFKKIKHTLNFLNFEKRIFISSNKITKVIAGYKTNSKLRLNSVRTISLL